MPQSNIKKAKGDLPIKAILILSIALWLIDTSLLGGYYLLPLCAIVVMVIGFYLIKRKQRQGKELGSVLAWLMGLVMGTNKPSEKTADEQQTENHNQK